MLLRTLLLGLVLGVSASAQDASPADAAALLNGQAGDVLVELNGALYPIGAGARLYVADGVAWGVALDRSVFADVDPSTEAAPFVASGAEAWTASGSLEWEFPAARWFVLSRGVQVYAQRQRSDVVQSWAPGSAAVVADGARVEEGAGAAVMLRMEARPAGRFRVGFVGSYVGLGVSRVLGGVREEDGQYRPPTADDEGLRLDLTGGSTRFYVGVRL